MNDSDLVRRLRDKGLLPIQTEFGVKLLSTESARVQILNGPPGAGATHTTVATIAEGIESGLLERVLIVAPRDLGFEAVRRLHDSAAEVPTYSVDKESLVEFEAKAGSDSDVWPRRGVFVTSLDFAKQNRVVKYFTDCNWDMVFFDEAQLLTPGTARGDLLRKTIGGPAKRIVLVDRLGAFHHTDDLLPGFSDDLIEVTTWQLPDLKTWDGKDIVRPQIDWQILQYDMNEGEAAFYEALATTAKQIDTAIGANSLFFQALMNRATSCLYSVERALMDQRSRIVHRRNELVHGVDRRYDQLLLFEDEDDGTIQPDTFGDPSQQVEQYEATIRQIDDTLAQLEELETDSKADELLRLLHALGEASVCILSQYESTVAYLESRLADEPPFRPNVLSGSVPSGELRERHAMIRSGPGLMLATDAILKGIDFPADVVVHYDLPLKPALLYVRVTRVSGPGRSGVVRMIGLVERNAVTGRLWEKLLERAQAMGVEDPNQDTETMQTEGDLG